MKLSVDKSKINRLAAYFIFLVLFSCVLVLFLKLSSLLLGPGKGACNKKACLSKFLEGPPAFNSNTMKSFLWKRYFVAPSGEPYALTGSRVKDDEVFPKVDAFIKEHFANEKNGKFVVMGAGDGEANDLTLYLERALGWTGLLIEPNPHLFEALKKKKRKAVLTNNCVSPFSYPRMVRFAYPKLQDTSMNPEGKIWLWRTTQIKDLASIKGESEEFDAFCVPLDNLLYAADITDKIDLLVADMAGTDLDVLVGTRFDNLPHIGMVVLYSHGNDINNEAPGYFVEKNLVLYRVLGTLRNNLAYIYKPFDETKEL